MNIKLAKTAGFCFGVERAVSSTEKALTDCDKPVYSLGDIIHNDFVVNSMREKGLIVIDCADEAPTDSVVIIRAHGISTDEFEKLKGKNCKIIDLTCPFVSKLQELVKKRADLGDIVFVLGNKKHPEIKGVVSRVKSDIYVFKNIEEIDDFIKNGQDLTGKSISVVSQTTFNKDEFDKCVKKINSVYTKVSIFDTICKATEVRQKEAIELSKTCDIMIVVGSPTSSNTKELYDICHKNCETYLVTKADELLKIDFSKSKSVGITAGASTPQVIIKEVLETMSGETKTHENEIDGMSFEEALEKSLEKMDNDQKVVGIVVALAPNEIQVDIGRKHTGYIPAEEYSYDPDADFTKELKVGDKLDLIIMKTNDIEGTVMLSKRRFDSLKAWDELEKAKEENATVEGTVKKIIKGGLLAVTNNGVRVFIPASHSGVPRSESLDVLVSKKVEFKILEINKNRRQIVGSIKENKKEIRKEATEKFWETAQVGDKYTGRVKNLTNYAAFVELEPGVDGMIPISELSWKRIKHPSDIVSVDDEIEVYIRSLENNRISLGYKKDEDNPWEILKKKYSVGDEITTHIVGLTTFGAFAEVIPGIDGLIHISQIADHYIEKPADVLSVGDEVTVKITDIEYDEKRVSLSIRALIDENAADEKSEDTEDKTVDAKETEAEEKAVEEKTETVSEEVEVKAENEETSEE
ncbi:MAG: bifunctional 4-hydroxy-3-methylbut-2-enyl diphosphate reductase/30S ribosomal protein S1 [Clostridia bacterium]|nr:bifunctional 4-hydroxy-3-methylbut-2-enyl diphosphate reductase/30S ribosomal protein S1 [Clostridia bacterium]